MELCSFGASMSQISGNRFALGIGRGFEALYRCFGVDDSSLKGLRDLAEILRRVWNDGAFSGDSALGHFPYLFVAEPPRNPPPLLLGTMGPKALELAGRYYDGVLLHPFISDEAVAAHTDIVRTAAERAGRAPLSVKVWTIMVCAADQSDEETSALGPARLLTYVHHEGLGEQICRTNHWDTSILTTIRQHPLFEGGRKADQDFTRYETEEVAALLPGEWLSSTAALGSAEHCAKRLKDHLNAGADGVLIHGSVPKQVGSLLQAYEKVRDNQRFVDSDPWFQPSPAGTGMQ